MDGQRSTHSLTHFPSPSQFSSVQFSSAQLMHACIHAGLCFRVVPMFRYSDIPIFRYSDIAARGAGSGGGSFLVRLLSLFTLCQVWASLSSHHCHVKMIVVVVFSVVRLLVCERARRRASRKKEKKVHWFCTIRASSKRRHHR
ncbi:hypothetical protein IWX50DRAFT_362327 [Phyllosticta citricarpa]|uniref:Uncharacterized protein n=1 Tax=Phyllosticta citricarpa TaxID=55181 RepID=A0ABR1LPE3_9PEZI